MNHYVSETIHLGMHSAEVVTSFPHKAPRISRNYYPANLKKEKQIIKKNRQGFFYLVRTVYEADNPSPEPATTRYLTTTGVPGQVCLRHTPRAAVTREMPG